MVSQPVAKHGAKGLSAISWQPFIFLVALRYIGGMLWRVRH
jgi:hypothetical protein